MSTSAALMQIAVTVVSAIITTVLLPLLAQWLISKTHNQKVQTAVLEITQLVATSVDYVEQVYVSSIKKSGTWDAHTQQQVREYAINGVINNLSAATKSWLSKNVTDVRDMVESYIEAYIQQSKQGDGNSENNKGA